ncbi:hypothetical protein [Mucilaginibacter sp. SJ]|uniref:hypothetical protein n=1 Tax=Mucilaginibacter sp. SJ TaxID=3029053 RepID=UPI0023A9B4EB|nr:hypothetical protein [Mucilaginibacter sp. SJ]WEA01826.1 hypothetical protein MusilaSJ_02670 [Mucilaginibacter sp. SJ]
MIYLSAQPDEYYFLWQLKLQLFNFVRLGIPEDSIHILIGFDQERGLSQEFQKFKLEYPSVNIYDYPDTRICKEYIPSIRPHIIAKHFTLFPQLQYETLFYHDSDVLFSNLPDFLALNEDETWYCSDTRGYLSAQYIKSTVDDEVFKEACLAVGISPSMVESDDENAGGAQYLLKNVSALFWQKIERDSTSIFSIFEADNDRDGFCARLQPNVRIQSWCADMWAIWWNALFFKIPFKISKELDFAWAGSPIDEWVSKRILHYTGSAEKEDKSVFRKSNYTRYPPFHDDLSAISELNCSFPLKQLIEDYNSLQQKKRIDLSDFTYLFVCRIRSEYHLENLYTIVKHLTINYTTNIIIIEADGFPLISPHRLPKEVNYFFFEDDNPQFHITRFNNLGALKAKTKFIGLCDDACVIVPEKQITQGVSMLRNGASIISPYDGNLLNIDILLKSLYVHIQDTKLLEENVNKLKTLSKRSYAGMLMVNREVFLSAGGDNQRIISPGVQIMERIKRMQILGFQIKRVSGNLYWLPPKVKSKEMADTGYEESMTEYLMICTLTEKELMKHIETWRP